MKKSTTKMMLLLALGCILAISKLNAQCVASFTYSILANGNVQFYNTSTPTVSTTWSWNFGNGQTSNLHSPSITYTANGTYVVNLFMMLVPTCSASTQQTIVISNVAGCGLTANFNYSQGTNGLVNFNNTTTGAAGGVTYLWDFGDNTSTSSATNPSHTYSANGTYIATLTANNNYTYSCTSTKTLAVNVTSYCNLNASFTYSLGAGGVVYFYSTSTGTTGSTTYTWSFGTTPPSNTFQNPSPTHTFINGTYIVTLSIANASIAPTCFGTATQTITVTSATCNLSAGFTYSIYAPNSLSVTSTSGGTGTNTQYMWHWGDGSSSGPSGSLGSTTHSYAATGIKNVTLVIFDSSTSCADSITHAVNMGSVTCVANANFSLIASNTPQYWYAIPASPNNVVSAVWSWGDGSSTNTLYASHQYSASATYSICLSVTVSCGASATFCAPYYIFRGNSSSDVINVDVIPPGTTGIENRSADGTNISVYPNPSHGEFTFSGYGLNKEATISIYNLVGEQVYLSKFETDNGVLNQKINLDKVAGGVYFVKVNSGTKNYSNRIMINK